MLIKYVLVMNKSICKTDADGTKHWFLDDKLHRTDGPAIELVNGDKYWYFDNKRHRTDGPAVECASGTKYWFLDGKRHRTDGPAIERADGYKRWYLNGKQIDCKSQEEFERLMRLKAFW